jgi:proteasome lid subunit RPN8/RPN11
MRPAGTSLDLLDRMALDLQSLNSLIRDYPIFAMVNPKGSILQHRYRLMSMTQTVIKVKKDGEPLLGSGILLDISLGIDYPNQPPVISFSRDRIIPFHPFVQIAHFSRSVWWVDFSKWREVDCLGRFLLRVVRSLAFDPNYIDLNFKDPGNDRALSWYKHMLTECPSIFPIGRDDIPEVEAFNPLAKVKLILPSDHTSSNPQALKRFSIIESSSPGLIPLSGNTTTAPTPITTEETNPPPSASIEPSALDRIKKHIGWGQITPQNRYEQGGLLLGRILTGEESSFLHTRITYAIAGPSTDRGEGFLRLGHDVWRQMMEDADRYVEQGNNAQIVGWYHTHPNNLDVFMSNVDRSTQDRMFRQDWHIAVVLNPHRKIVKAFRGRQATPCGIELVRGTEDVLGADETDGGQLKIAPGLEETTLLSKILRSMNIFQPR